MYRLVIGGEGKFGWAAICRTGLCRRGTIDRKGYKRVVAQVKVNVRWPCKLSLQFVEARFRRLYCRY